jgi:hypothetical protein
MAPHDEVIVSKNKRRGAKKFACMLRSLPTEAGDNDLRIKNLYKDENNNFNQIYS